MKASEFIIKLQAAIEADGDLEIGLEDADALTKIEPLTVAIDETVSPKCFVVTFSSSFFRGSADEYR